MEAAYELFTRLQGFLQDEAQQPGSAEQKFLSYVTQILGQTERLHFDFKQKANRSYGLPDEPDKKNFAKAISGFANSAGGVLIWGIEDESLQQKPITDVAQFQTTLLELSKGSTDPVVPGIDGFIIPANNNPSFGYAIVLIPESLLPPHRVILKIADIQDRYYIRTGSSFVVAPHVQLEDMFGRRPRPLLHFAHRLSVRRPNSEQCEVTVILGIENRGRGVAKAPFLGLNIHPPYHLSQSGLDGNGKFGLPTLTVANEIRERQFGAGLDKVIHSGMTQDVAIVSTEVRLRYAPPPQDLTIDYRIAADGIQTTNGCLVLQAFDLTEAVRNSLARATERRS